MLTECQIYTIILDSKEEELLYFV